MSDILKNSDIDLAIPVKPRKVKFWNMDIFFILFWVLFCDTGSYFFFTSRVFC